MAKKPTIEQKVKYVSIFAKHDMIKEKLRQKYKDQLGYRLIGDDRMVGFYEEHIEALKKILAESFLEIENLDKEETNND